MNECVFVGRLTDDPKIKDIGETKLTTFSLGIEETRKDKDGQTKRRYDYLDFEAWDSGAQTIYDHCRKGDFLVVQCSARHQKWDTPEGDRKQKINFRVNTFKIFPSTKND
jgi:single-strand DNA-binding protein